MRQMKQLVLAIIFATACGSIHAFDGDRRGFMIGAGGGFHTTDFDASNNGFAGSPDSEFGAVLRLTVGAGINEKFTVYGIYDIEQDDDTVYGLLGPGGTFYFRDAGPSAYLFGGAGLGVLSFSDRERFGNNRRFDYETATGFGLLFGGGYAFTRGFHVDGSVMYLDVTDDDNFEFDTDYEITSLRVTASYVWF